MKAADRDKLIIDMSGKVTWMYEKLNGNGQPGYLKRLDDVETRQIENQKTKMFNTTTAIAIVSAAISLAALISIFTGG